MWTFDPELKAQGKFPIVWRYRGRTKAETLESLKAIDKAQGISPIKTNHTLNPEVINILPRIQQSKSRSARKCIAQ